MFSTFFGLPKQKQVSVPAKTEILIQGQITDLMEIQAGMVMDQTFPLRQAPVMRVGSGVGD